LILQPDLVAAGGREPLGVADGNLLIALHVRGQTQLATGLAGGVRPGDDPGPRYARLLLRLADPEHFPRLTAAMAQHAAGPPADFADDAFRFGLSTVLDGIACRA
jgi:hypothetical protein